MILHIYSHINNTETKKKKMNTFLEMFIAYSTNIKTNFNEIQLNKANLTYRTFKRIKNTLTSINIHSMQKKNYCKPSSELKHVQYRSSNSCNGKNFLSVQKKKHQQ